MYRAKVSIHNEDKYAKRRSGARKAVAGKRISVAKAINRSPLSDVSNLVKKLPNQANLGNDINQENRPVSKRGFLLNRPITRRFGVHLACRQQVVKPVTAAQLSRCPERDTELKATWERKARLPVKAAVAVDEQVDLTGTATTAVGHVSPVKCIRSETVGCPVVISKKHREPTLTSLLTARSEAASRCIHAEVLYEEAVANIDANDADNQLAVVDYVEDIYSFYRKSEVRNFVPPTYLSSQLDINEKMRSILIDWLIEVHHKFKLMPETLFLTINVIDRFLASQSISRKNLQLAGVTAMLVAAKYEEICYPQIDDLVFISDSAFTREDVLSMEIKMLNKLRFNLTVPTPYVFIIRFLKAASADEQLEHLALYFAELCLTEYVMMKFQPSLLAAAAVYTAKCTLQKLPLWDRIIQFHTGYSETQLKVCANLMVAFHENAKTGHQKTVYEKYASSKFSVVAKIGHVIFPH
eukprot:c39081_g1_i1 orf=330-1733(-)